MIGKLTGRIGYKGGDHVLIETAGVGYLVYVSERTLASLPAAGEHVSLFTDLLVREDLLQLFGFPTLAEKEWHRLLMSVQGIGAKASMAILGTIGPDGLAQSIALGDWSSVKAAPGVGPKIAQRVVNELKGKAPAMMALPGETLTEAVSADAVVEAVLPTSNPTAQADALSALGNLGYAPGEAAAAVAEAARAEPDAEASALIRSALKRLAPA